MKGFPVASTINDLFPNFEKSRDTCDIKDGAKVFHDIEEPDFWRIYEEWKPYTLLSTERVYNLYQVTRYIAANGVPGDFVECGVLLGGASIMMALFADHFGLRDRRHYLFDTFRGPVRPTVVTDYAGRKIIFGECPSFRSIVENNIARCGVDPDRLVLVEGPVQETLPHVGLKSLCLLRLDTDDYESTLHELRTMYPVIEPFGALIIDDYGYYRGSRKAVDEYLGSLEAAPLLQRIDCSGRCGIKTSYAVPV